MQSSVIHVLPLTFIRRERLLPVSGKVLARVGQKVLATDVIAEGRTSDCHQLLDISRGLGVGLDEADKLVVRKVGDLVEKGGIIAGPVGVLHRTVSAPENGMIVAIGDGQVLMELEGTLLELRAGIPGTVVQIIPDRGAVIETTGALIQGVWGNGQMDKSIMNVLSHAPAEELTSSQLDVSRRGSIVLGGILTQEETLRTAIGLPLRGLIMGSMPSHLLPVALKAPFPILLLSGFGKLPIDPVSFAILTTNEQREVTVNACAWDRFQGQRPEVVIPLPSSGTIPPPPQADIFASGQTVRIQRAPHAGKAGTIASLKPSAQLFSSGIRASAAVINLDNGEQVVVPLANLEVIE